MRVPLIRASALTFAFAILACEPAISEGSGEAGSPSVLDATGGSVAAGGTAVGGNQSAGGASAGGALDGTAGLGGLPGSGGGVATGGLTATGGIIGAGGDVGSGGRVAVGGALGAGGSPAAGGVLGIGGGDSSGGAVGLGGVFGAGGSVGTGGNVAVGGAVAMGGTLGSGGSSDTGGAVGSGGEAGASGAVGSGGETGTGGAATTCGTYSWACWPMPNPPSTGLPNSASHTDNGDGTVQDDVTGLIWQQDVGGSYVWSDAISYCEDLSLAGHDDWRLPTRIELLSIVDHTRTSPAVDTSVLPTPSGFFWTATPWAVSADPPRSWIVNFYEGLTSNNGYTTGEYNARCVRGGPADGSTSQDPPPDLYSEVTAGEIRDRWTGLIWTQATSPASMSYEDAVTYCSEFNLNGNAWRLPSVNELATLVDERTVSPAIDTSTFPDTAPNHYYWSQTEWAGSDPDLPWGLNYNDGYSGHGRDDLLVRCVR